MGKWGIMKMYSYAMMAAAGIFYPRCSMGSFLQGDDKFKFEESGDMENMVVGYTIIHYIFSTEGQQDSIPEARLDELWARMDETVRRTKSTPFAIGGTPNHAHLLIDVNLNMSIEDLINRVRNDSRRWMRQNVPGAEAFAWQQSYAAFSASDTDVNVLSAYIRNQEAVHRHKTFQQEFKEYLERHELEYDESDLWD